MQESKYTACIDNIYFLSLVGSSLRWATQDIAQEELPANIKRLLARLDRLEPSTGLARGESLSGSEIRTI
jgi:hypothetical protein